MALQLINLMIEALVAEEQGLAEQDSSNPNSSSFVYHGTNEDGVWGMKETGFLKPFNPSHGTPDQDEWPDEGTEPRAYFSPSPSGVAPFYPSEGKWVLLRLPTTSGEFRKERGTRDIYTQKPISVKSIEFMDEETEEWKPLASYGEEETIQQESNAIGGGGVSATGGGPLGIDMGPAHKTMWSGDDELKESNVLDKMGLKKATSNIRRGALGGGEVYMDRHDPDEKNTKKVVQKVAKNLNKKPYSKDPPRMGLQEEEKKEKT